MLYEKAFSEILRHCLKFEQLILDIDEAKQSQTGINYALELLLSIIDYLESHPEIAEINSHLNGVNWYRHHLDELTTISEDDTRFL